MTDIAVTERSSLQTMRNAQGNSRAFAELFVWLHRAPESRREEFTGEAK